MYVDGIEVAVQPFRLNKPVFISCTVSAIAVLCYNDIFSGTFAAKSYNSISNRLVTDNTWLVYNSSQPLFDNWYISTYDDSSWRIPYTIFPYLTIFPDWHECCALPEFYINDTFWLIQQSPYNLVYGNDEHTYIYYRYKIESKLYILCLYRPSSITRVYLNVRHINAHEVNNCINLCI